MSELKYEMKGDNGQLEVYDDKIIIKRKETGLSPVSCLYIFPKLFLNVSIPRADTDK